MTADEAVAVAIVLQQNGQLDEAQQLYRLVLADQPDHADALHYTGVLAHQQGRSDEATALIERSLSLSPDRADGFNNLGIVHQASGRLDAAIAAYHRAIAIDPGHANAHSNLGVLLRATGQPAAAEASYRTALRLSPTHLDTHHNLGILLNGLGRTEEAAACFSRLITLRPQHKDARRLLALAHCTLGEVDAARRIYAEWLAEEPADPIATHMYAACGGGHTPPRASDAFVEQTFDRFAASFESKLAQLAYRAPALIAAMLEHVGVQAVGARDILDAGCGTGLCGPLLAPYARRLVGVDLSEGMLTQARQKSIYDELVRGELTAYLQSMPQAFDLIVSADTLVYVGDLTAVATAAAAALTPGGWFVFTLEQAAHEARGGFRLEMHGRYSHTMAYVEQVFADAACATEIAQAELRMEAGVPVAGLVVAARRE